MIFFNFVAFVFAMGMMMRSAERKEYVWAWLFAGSAVLNAFCFMVTAVA